MLVVFATADLLDEPLVASRLWTPILSAINVVVVGGALVSILPVLWASKGSTLLDHQLYMHLTNLAREKTGTAIGVLILSCVMQNVVNDAKQQGFMRNGVLHISDSIDTPSTMTHFVCLYVVQKALLMFVVLLSVHAIASQVQFWVAVHQRKQ